MNLISALILLAALAGQLRASALLGPPAESTQPALQTYGSYLQTIKNGGAQQDGWASLRSAFHSRAASVTCPGSQSVRLTATVHAKCTASQNGSSSTPLLKHPWRRRVVCTPTATGSSCNLTLPAAGLAVLQLQLPAAAAGGSPPQSCTATFRTVLAPLVILRCLLGVWLVLFAHRALSTRPGQAALRLCNAAAQAAAPWKRQLRAALAAEAVCAALLAFIRARIDDWPAEGRWVGAYVCCCRSDARRMQAA
jgi:hypothetical protein